VHVRRLLSFARYNWLNVFETRSFAWMDTVVLALFVSPSLVGIYEVAWRLASVLGLITISVQMTLFPELSDLSARGDFERVKHLINEGLVYTGLFVIPGLFGAVVIGREVLKIYRPEFTQGATVLLILIGARIARAYSGPFVNAINAIDRPDVAFRIDAAFIAANLVLNVALVWAIGWYGAAIATALSTMLALVLGYASLRRLVGAFALPLGEFGRQIVASVVMGGAVWATTFALPSNHYVTVAQVLFGAVVYSAVLLAISRRVRSKAIALGRSTAFLG
jgi:O-antigen/teichoic acid export membrane protein